MGSTSSRAVVGGVVVALGVVACEPRPAPGPARLECIVDDDPDVVAATERQGLVAEQAIVRIPPSAVEVFLDDDSGGPLRCRPSGGPCPALEACVGAPVQVPVGTQATLAVGLRALEPIRAIIESAVFAGADPAFTILGPLPPFVEATDPVFILVAVTPTFEDVITAEVEIVTDARNAETEPLRITLQVEGVQP